MRSRHCRVCHGWHDVDEPWPWDCRGHFGSVIARSELHAPMLIRDCMDATLNPADGKRYTSKREYYRAVRRAGCEIVGNENMAKHIKPKDLSDPTPDIIDAIKKVNQGYKPPPRRRMNANG